MRDYDTNGLFFGKPFNWMPHGCKMHRGFWQVYGEEAHEGRCVEVSMLNQATERCFGCHMLLEPQTSSQTCPEIPSITVPFKQSDITT